jgi:alkyl sulfatase BDS1-like metallo-beta-lactamase superfamily hydrolase
MTDDVYTVVGYDSSNCALSIGDDGLIIVDTLR